MAQHSVNAAFVKVSIGSATGNRVARILRRGDVVPDGVEQKQLEHLVERGLITEIKPAETAPARGRATSARSGGKGRGNKPADETKGADESRAPVEIVPDVTPATIAADVHPAGGNPADVTPPVGADD